MSCLAMSSLALHMRALFAPGLAPASFRRRVADILCATLDCQQVSFVSFTPATRQLEVVFEPFLPEMAPGLEGFGKHMADFPCFNCDPTVNNGKPFFRSDFLSDEEFYQSAIYQEGFRVAGISDHAAMLLPSDDEMVFFLGMEKRDGKTFDRSFRCRMEVLQPLFDNAHRLASLLASPPLGETPVETEIFERAGFSHRQADVLALLLLGKSNSEISIILGISLTTVKGHVAAIFDKFGVGNRHAAILRAYEIVRPSTPNDDPADHRAATRAEPQHTTDTNSHA